MTKNEKKKKKKKKKKKQRKARLNIRQGNFGQTHPEILFHFSLYFSSQFRKITFW